MKLVFRYQTVIHSVKDSILIHECLASEVGQLYAVNPVPVNVKGEIAKAVEKDSLKYLPVKVESIKKELLRWKEEVDLEDDNDPLTISEDYDSIEEIDDDYYDEHGEVMDLVEYMERNR